MDSATIDAFTPAIAMLDALNKRQVSAVELLDMHLRRIERYNPTLGAIVTFAIEHARQAADRPASHRALSGRLYANPFCAVGHARSGRISSSSQV